MRDPYDPKLASKPLRPEPLLTARVTAKNNAVTNRTYLSELQYEQIRYGAMEIVKRYPTKDNFYVTIGRDPTPIAAFLENLAAPGAKLSTTLPASGLRDGVVQGHEAAWTAHLDQFLPSDVIHGGKTILLIDRSSTGATLTKVKDIVQRYVAAKGGNAKVDVIALARRVVPVPWIDITKYQELVELNQDHYAPWSEWPRYEVGVTSPAALQRQASYDTFKAALSTRMQRDADLSNQIAALKE